MSKHTPAPWHVGEGQQAQIVYDKNGWGIANAVVFHSKHERGSSLANALLIAAAPDLLEALQKMMICFDDGVGVEWNALELDAARAAIAKANGESK